LSAPADRPLVAEIKRNSLDDGPGIRAVVFFKGCPLHCVWCHNPECIEPGPELLWQAARCIGCRACAASCPEQAIGEQGPAGLDRDKCNLCGRCVDECPSGALSAIGRYYTPEALVEELVRDKRFYDNSGGGVTLSGGEPTLFAEYSGAVARMLKQRGVRICLETCGDFEPERFASQILPHLDLVLVDVKLLDAQLHKRFTGRDNGRILRNIEGLLAQSAVEVLVRVPLIPEVTATPDNLAAIAAWLRERGVGRIALLPYNPLWISKAQGLGRPPGYERKAWMSPAERDAVKNIFSGFILERDI